jgi:CBS domain-containing protein
VVGEHGPVGIISERDVVTALAGGADPDQVWAADVMSEKPVVVSPEDSLDEVVAAMATHWVRHLPVVDNGKVRGMISVRDVVLALTEPPSETVFSDADDQLAVWEHVEHIEEESLTPEGLEAQLEGFPEAPEEAAMHEEGV